MAPAPSPLAPQWSEIAEEVTCPLCGYNLRGLTEPRCPECGYSFSWPQVIDPAFRLHPWMFEHHPERNVWSFVRTALGAFWPSRFWSSLLPVQPSNVRRLLLYWAVGVVFYAAALVFGLAIEVLGEAQSLTALAAGTPGLLYAAPTPSKIAMTVLQSRGVYAGLTLALFIPAVWPWATFAVFLIFQVSMRRQRLRAPHILRISLYSFDQLFWAGMLLNMGFAVKLMIAGLSPGYTLEYREFLALGPQVRFALGDLLLSSLLFGFLPYLHGLWRLRTACKRYLQFNVPFGTVVATQVIVLLLVCCLIMFSPTTRPFAIISDTVVFRETMNAIGPWLDRVAAWCR